MVDTDWPSFILAHGSEWSGFRLLIYLLDLENSMIVDKEPNNNLFPESEIKHTCPGNNMKDNTKANYTPS